MKNDFMYNLRKKMVDEQILGRGIKTKKVIDAFLHVPRHSFVSASYQTMSYNDHPLPIENNQTISQPYMVALMTDQLDIQKQDKVLEIGTGSGYQTAILSILCDQVYTIELHKLLSMKSKSLLNNLGYKNIHYLEGNGYDGWKEFSPYDKIIVTAAPQHIPNQLIDQLKDQGKMIVPVGNSSMQQLLLIEKKSNHTKKTFITYCRFVEMVENK